MSGGFLKKTLSAYSQESLFSSGKFENLERRLLTSIKRNHVYSEEDCIQASCIARYYCLHGNLALGKEYLPELNYCNAFSERCKFYVYFAHAQISYEIDNDLKKSYQLYNLAEKYGKNSKDVNVRQMMVGVYWRLGTIAAYYGLSNYSTRCFEKSLFYSKEEITGLAYAIYSLSQVWYHFANQRYIKSLEIIFSIFFQVKDLSKLEYLKTEFLFAFALCEIRLSQKETYIYVAKTLEIVEKNLCYIGRGNVYIPYLGVLKPQTYYDVMIEEKGRIYPPTNKYTSVKELAELCEIVPICEKCGCKDLNELTVDHIIPRKYGGSNYDKNLRILCRKCNSQKSSNIMTFDNNAYLKLKKGLIYYDSRA